LRGEKGERAKLIISPNLSTNPGGILHVTPFALLSLASNFG